VLDDFMSQWAEPNRAVATRCLGDESGQLFRRPRRSRHTTTEQHLDPARVDAFVSLLELPDHWRAPLRRVAEREAAAR
jgi:hypothetical protein